MQRKVLCDLQKLAKLLGCSNLLTQQGLTLIHSSKLTSWLPLHMNSSRSVSSNPMLNGVSLLQWFFDEVRPDQREVRYWMKYFSQATDPFKTFAVIQIDEGVFEQEKLDQEEKENGKIGRTIIETLALSLYFLQQNRMNIILLVGSSETSALNRTQSNFVRDSIYANIMNLCDKVQESGVLVYPLLDGGHVFFTNNDQSEISVNAEHIGWLCKNRAIPIIACIAEDRITNEILPININEAVHHVALYTQPLKVLLLNSTGGITDENSQKITTVFLPRATELQKFDVQPWWNEEIENRFLKVCSLLNILPKSSSYVITGANDVLTELLTQRGFGTMFKRVVPVTKYHDLNDTVRSTSAVESVPLTAILHEIIESSFNKRLTKGYWEGISGDLNTIYLTEDLKSCAIVRNFPHLPGVMYLDKFAVCREERGNFNTDVLWQQIKEDHQSLFWRSRSDNLINNWYESRSEGIVKIGRWHVFWYGMSHSDIKSALNICEERPSSFEDTDHEKTVLVGT